MRGTCSDDRGTGELLGFGKCRFWFTTYIGTPLNLRAISREEIFLENYEKLLRTCCTYTTKNLTRTRFTTPKRIMLVVLL